MRTQLLGVWLLLPVAAGAYHMGPGQDLIQLDDAAALLEDARGHTARAEEIAAELGDVAATMAWKEAFSAYEEALLALPSDRVGARREVQLERAKCRMMISQLPEANSELRTLVDEMSDDPEANPAVLLEARRSFASSEYYMTWLMRLEGLGRADWEPRIESARQTYKLLAEQYEIHGDEANAETSREDLESAIRLARMELSELQGLPLPSQ